MWRAAFVTPVEKLTANAVAVEVVLKDGRFRFKPGQFVVIEREVEDGVRRSAFSIVQGTKDGFILGVKQQGHAGISAWLNALQEKVQVQIAGPFGGFQPRNGKNLVLFAGGSGITPCMSIIDNLIASGEVPTLIYANRSPAESMFRDALHTWSKAGKLTLYEFFDHDLTPALTNRDFSNTAFFICGPMGFMENVTGMLKQSGVTEDSMHLEYFGWGPGGTLNAESVFQWISRFGRKQIVRMGRHRSVLEAATSAGLDIPHACGAGACGSCRVRIAEGEVYCGSEKKGAGDTTLACISRPTGQGPIVLRPVKSLTRMETVAAALLVGLLSAGLWNVPPGPGLKAKGTMNTGHENLECNACHKPAEGTTRQQLGHNAQVLMTGVGDWTPVGFDEVDNNACLTCHDRPNDRHPVSRFNEPRFAKQRQTLAPHQCNSCHGEHNGGRVMGVEPQFCQNCHADLVLEDDPIDIDHATLIEQGDWTSCLGCHDFHGNHVRTTPMALAESIDRDVILEYLEGGVDPYGEEKRYAPTPPTP